MNAADLMMSDINLDLCFITCQMTHEMRKRRGRVLTAMERDIPIDIIAGPDVTVVRRSPGQHRELLSRHARCGGGVIAASKNSAL